MIHLRMHWDVSIYFTRSPMKVWFTWDSNHLLNIFLIILMLWTLLLSSWPWNHPVNCIHSDIEMCLLTSNCSFAAIWIDTFADITPTYNRIPTDLNHLEIPTLCHLTYIVYSAMPWPRWLATSLSPWRHDFIPTEVHVGFVVCTWHWDRFLSLSK